MGGWEAYEAPVQNDCKQLSSWIRWLYYVIFPKVVFHMSLQLGPCWAFGGARSHGCCFCRAGRPGGLETGLPVDQALRYLEIDRSA